MPKTEAAQSPERAVLVTTEFRGVFFGYASDTSKVPDRLVLKRARNCIYWSTAVRGFLGLAEKGPAADCRVGPSVEKLELVKITSVAEVTAAAVEAWEKAPWA